MNDEAQVSSVKASLHILNQFKSIKVDSYGNISTMKLIMQALQTPGIQRKHNHLKETASLVNKLPFFKERNMNNNAIADMMSLMTLRQVPKDEFVIQYGDDGEEFYVILSGDCEILIPDKKNLDLKDVEKQLGIMNDNLKHTFEEFV